MVLQAQQPPKTILSFAPASLATPCPRIGLQSFERSSSSVRPSSIHMSLARTNSSLLGPACAVHCYLLSPAHVWCIVLRSHACAAARLCTCGAALCSALSMCVALCFGRTCVALPSAQPLAWHVFLKFSFQLTFQVFGVNFGP